jgi:hypothetical protein
VLGLRWEVAGLELVVRAYELRDVDWAEALIGADYGGRPQPGSAW